VKALLTALALAVALVHMAVFGLFFMDVRRLGGTAFNGGEVDGKCWVVDHGRRSEVSAEDYRRNRALGIAVFAGTPVAMAALGFLLFTRVVPWFLYPLGTEELARAVKRVRESGAAVAEASTGGRIGWCNFSRPMLRLSVHPGGVVVKPLWMEPFAVERDQVTAVGRKRFLFVERIEFEHTSPDVRSPIRFEGEKDAPFVAALEGLRRTEPDSRRRR
jgi:hypothetical protein